MSNFLRKIRNQPEDKKFKFLVLYTIIVLIILSFVWYYLSSIVVGSVKYVADDKQENISGVELLKGAFEEFFGSVADGIFEVKNKF